VIELILELGEDWMLRMCLWVVGFALVLNRNFRILGCQWMRWLGVFIASNHFLAVGNFCWRWAHRTDTVDCLVRATSASPLGFRASWPLEPLSCSCTGQSDDLWLLWSDFCRALFIIVHFCSQPLTRSDRCLAGSSGMSGAHRTVRWIIAERARVTPWIWG
jgi:hypothetical protein